MIVIIPFTNDRVHVHRFDIEEALDKSGIDYLYVTSTPPSAVARNAAFTYPLAVRSKKGGVKYKVESGPEGMQVDAKGVLTWNVPPDAVGEQNIILTVSDASGQEIFHTFRLSVTEPVPAKKD
jgi:hypothetical protein